MMQATKKSTIVMSKLALGPADPALTEPKVVAQFTLTPMTKSIEQVGKAYEILKGRFHRLEENMENGASAQFSDLESESDEEDKKRPRVYSIDTPAKKQARKERKIIERTFCDEGNLYGVLDLETKTWEATVKEVRKQYQQQALKYHPDKLGGNITERQNEMWLMI
jgi:DnaJ family protein C protein 2